MASRTRSKGEKAVSDLKATPGIKGTISFQQLDVTDDASIKAAVEAVESEYGHLDVLVNNAGVASQDPSLRTQLETTFAANVFGAALVYDAFKPLLLKSKSSVLIHVSSGLGSFDLATRKDRFDYDLPYTVYRMSKSALDMLALENYKEKVREGWNLKV